MDKVLVHWIEWIPLLVLTLILNHFWSIQWNLSISIPSLIKITSIHIFALGQTMRLVVVPILFFLQNDYLTLHLEPIILRYWYFYHSFFVSKSTLETQFHEICIWILKIRQKVHCLHWQNFILLSIIWVFLNNKACRNRILN